MFESLAKTKPDAIIQMIALTAADTNPDKMDLGIGVYQDEQGMTPVMRAIKDAEHRHLALETSKKYIGIHGNPEFNRLFSELLLGKSAPVLSSGRLAMAQCAGGSGALRIGSELIKLANSKATIWASTPTWANHKPLVGSVGLPIKHYPYYNLKTQIIDFEDMCDTLRRKTKPGDAILLHGCCHNPTGADLTQAQWRVVRNLVLEKQLLPFIDLAYAGLGDGLEEDCYGLRLMADACEELVAAISCSKNFGLYKERTGLVLAIATNPDAAKLCHGQIGVTTRQMISMPPDHGAALVAKILADPDLCADWRNELETMRLRMKSLRQMLADALQVQGAEQMANAITMQKGMFSLLPVSPAQAKTLREKHSVYLLDSGRINVAGIKAESVERLAEKLLDVY